MTHTPQIRLHLLLKSEEISIFSSLNTFIHILLRPISDIRSPRFDICSEKQNTLFAKIEDYFVWMECELEFVMKKVANLHYHIFEYCSLWMKKYHIIHIATVVFHLECMFYKMIQLMEVEIAEQLTDQISQRKSYFWRCRKEGFMLWKIGIDST